jgi:hypothetical protein
LEIYLWMIWDGIRRPRWKELSWIYLGIHWISFLDTWVWRMWEYTYSDCSDTAEVLLEFKQVLTCGTDQWHRSRRYLRRWFGDTHITPSARGCCGRQKVKDKGGAVR